MSKRTAAPPPAYRSYINDMIGYCLGITFHSVYRYKVVFPEKPHPEDEDSNSTTHAAVHIDHVYLNVSFHLYPALSLKWKSKDYRYIGEVILHECCHLFTHPIRDHYEWNERQSEKEACRRTVERQTCMIETAINGLLPEDWCLPPTVAATMKRVSDKPRK